VADGISVQDITGKLVFINDAGAQLLGFSTAQEFMDSTEKLSPEMFRKKYLDRFEMRDELDKQIPYNELPAYKVLQGAEQAEKVINYYDTKTRLSHWSIVKSRPSYDDEGKVQLAVNIFSDITERKLVEKQKDEFISIASHELKTPLTGIKGFTQLLEKYFKEKQDKKAMDYLNYMNGQVGRLTNLIENFLDISKIQSGKLVFQEAIFKFDELVDELIKEVQLSTDHKIINESNTDVYVFGDRFRVGQVLTNLLTNAIKYSPQGEKVIVKTKHDKDIITVAVKDFGIGIPPDKQYKIFERFYRVPGKATESYPGMGLGLFISQEIIKRHNGKMWVKSKEGKGSTFYFTLPITLHSQFGKQ
jgi:signal transduction histidine kinase